MIAIKETLEKVEKCIEQLPSNAADDYGTWTNLGLAIANDLKESGRSLFHKFSEKSGKYDYTENDKKYNELLKTGNGSIKLGSLFEYCKSLGIDHNKLKIATNGHTLEKATPEKKTADPHRFIKDILSKEAVNISEEIQPAKIAFGVLDLVNPLKKYTIGTCGNFLAISGKAKSRKSFLVALFTGLILKNTKLFVYTTLENPKIVIFDTEQGSWHCQKAFKRIMQISGLNENDFDKKIKYVRLRNYDTNTREQVINYVIRNENPDIVVIDGIRDLAFDINSPQEATVLATKLLNWSGEYNCHIITVLHQNKADTNLRGHLGSEILNKCEAVLSVTKDPKDKDISVVEPTEMREQEFPPFAFRINEEGTPEILEGYVSHEKKAAKPEPDDIDFELHKNVLKDIYKTQKDLSQAALIPFLKVKFKEKGFRYGDNKLRDFISFYEMEGLLINISDTINGASKKLNFKEP